MTIKRAKRRNDMTFMPMINKRSKSADYFEDKKKV